MKAARLLLRDGTCRLVYPHPLTYEQWTAWILEQSEEVWLETAQGWVRFSEVVEISRGKEDE